MDRANSAFDHTVYEVRTHYADTDPLRIIPIYTNYFVCDKLGDVINSVNDNGSAINNINGKLSNVTIDANQNFVLSTPLIIQNPIAPFNDLLTSSYGIPDDLGTTLDINLTGSLNVKKNITQIGSDNTNYNLLNTTFCEKIGTNYITPPIELGKPNNIAIGTGYTNIAMNGPIFQQQTLMQNQLGRTYARQIATSYITAPNDLNPLYGLAEFPNVICIGNGLTQIILNGNVVKTRVDTTEFPRANDMQFAFINQLGF
jgi:hypothetical protein